MLFQRTLSILRRFPSIPYILATPFHSFPTDHYQPAMYIKLLPALKDNYMYLLVDESTKEAAVIDPVEPDKVVQCVADEQIKLTTILTTHHHWDHSGGNDKLVSMVSDLIVCGGDDRIPSINKKVKNNDIVKVSFTNNISRR
jgi:hydroxyacylglutathione hydrolase